MTLQTSGPHSRPHANEHIEPHDWTPVQSLEDKQPDRLALPETMMLEKEANGNLPFAELGANLEFLPEGAPHTIGRSVLDREIARGGMGIIIRGRDLDFERDVAVKVLQSSHNANENLRRRFRNEACLTARLQHPGIVPIYESGQFPDGRPYYTMRLIKGQNLKILLSERRRTDQDLPRFLQVFEQVCQTLAYAHSEGVIHRDLKPSNIMVAPFGVVKVLDWGIAKVLSGGHSQIDCSDDAPAVGNQDGSLSDDESQFEADSKTQWGCVLGTLAYMAPEQALGEIHRIDEHVDVFGLGAILCEILTGKPPYCETNAVRLFNKVTAADLAAAHSRLDACGAEGDLVALAKSCLAKNPDDRPRNAVEVADVLKEYLESDLRRVERDMVRFFELSPDLFCLASLDGFFRRVNPNFTRVLGYSFEELVSRPFLDFVHVDDRESTLAEMAKLSLGLPCVRFRNRYRDVRNDYRQLEWTAKSVPEERLIFAVAREVTDRPGQ